MGLPMREFEVLFATKTAGPSGHPEKAVSEIGGLHWRLNRDSAIGWLGVDERTFYVNQGGQRIYLVGATHNGQTWLRTSKDWTQPNALLQLPNFPADHGT